MIVVTQPRNCILKLARFLSFALLFGLIATQLAPDYVNATEQAPAEQVQMAANEPLPQYQVTDASTVNDTCQSEPSFFAYSADLRPSVKAQSQQSALAVRETQLKQLSITDSYTEWYFQLIATIQASHKA